MTIAGGELFAEIVMVAGLTVSGTWLIWIMIKARDDLRHADVPHLPEEAKRTAANRGGGAAIGQRPFTQASDIAHRDVGL